MKNKLTDLNDHLFAQMERLSDETKTPVEVDIEVKRGKALVHVASQIIKNASLQVQVAKLISEKGSIKPHLPSTMTNGTGAKLIETNKSVEAKPQ